MIKIFTSSQKQLMLIFFIALSIRLIVFSIGLINDANFKTPDSTDYLNLAGQLVETGEYRQRGETEIFRVPGYPLFLAILKSFGLNLHAILIVQIFIGSISCLLVWRLCIEIFNDKQVAITAGLLQASTVIAIVSNVTILSETIFTFFLVLGLLLTELLIKSSSCSKQRKWLWLAIASGGSIAFCALCRAIILPVFPLFFAYIWWRAKKWQPAVLFAIPVIAVIMGWSIRNHLAANFSGFSSVSSINMYRYNGCALLAKKNGISFAAQQQKCDNELNNYSSQLTQAEFAGKKGMEIITADLFSYAVLHLKSDLNNFLPASGELFKIAGAEVGGNGTLAIINSEGIIAGVKHYFKGKWWLLVFAMPMILFLALIYLFFSVTLIHATGKNRQKWIIIFYFCLIAWFLLIPGPASHPRFRGPISPLMNILAAAGIFTSYQYYKLRKKLLS